MTISLAEQWRGWRLARLRAQITLLQAQLEWAQQEYDEMNRLKGEALQYRFGAYSAEELQPFYEDRQRWRRWLENFWIRAEVLRKPAA